ncbi:hypothetical protein [Caballeronia sp. LZ001]|uniref:hypothetical protein n=1 Tax=Caballeronia sp. LZ001 TaxID=3038553 RepID=UPI002866A770|nr:hypothetical protein [Caballeronia sp. LZ001]MDR5801220.1 hypothetical protein [Caballeronia sp. LZ001]
MKYKQLLSINLSGPGTSLTCSGVVCTGAVEQLEKLIASSVIVETRLIVFHIGSLLRGDCRSFCRVGVGLHIRRLASVEVVFGYLLLCLGGRDG